jgi:hypothetical protein
MYGIAKLNVGAFDEVSSDRGATQQAVLIVVIVAIATSIGFGESEIPTLISRSATTLVAWGVWTLLTYVIGGKLLATPEVSTSWGQVARVLGFAQSPGLLRAFGWLPMVGTLVLFVAATWQLIAVLFGLSQVLDYKSGWRMLLVAVITVIPYGVFIVAGTPSYNFLW